MNLGQNIKLGCQALAIIFGAAALGAGIGWWIGGAFGATMGGVLGLAALCGVVSLRV